MLIKGDIFNSNCQYLVNPVNCKGMLGSGLSVEFKERFPENYKRYYKICQEEKLKIGLIYVNNNIINFPTKIFPYDKSRPEYIAFGLCTLYGFLKTNKIESCALPALGCGQGGLNWFEVKNIFELWADMYDLSFCRLKIYEPFY